MIRRAAIFGLGACMLCSPAVAGETWICTYSLSADGKGPQILKFEIIGDNLIQSGAFGGKYVVLKNTEYGTVAASAEINGPNGTDNGVGVGFDAALIHKKDKTFALYGMFLGTPMGLDRSPLTGTCVNDR
jgi:hypothetical protein